MSLTMPFDFIKNISSLMHRFVFWFQVQFISLPEIFFNLPSNNDSNFPRNSFSICVLVLYICSHFPNILPILTVWQSLVCTYLVSYQSMKIYIHFTLVNNIYQNWLKTSLLSCVNKWHFIHVDEKNYYINFHFSKSRDILTV